MLALAAFLGSLVAVENTQPLFIGVWVGSVRTLISAALLGFETLSAGDRVLIIAAVALHVFLVQVPTVAINVPLNNRLQRLDVETLDDPARRRGPDGFERRRNRWNAIRTASASVTSAVLVLLLVRMTS